MKFDVKISNFAKTFTSQIEVCKNISSNFSIFEKQNQINMITKEQLIETIKQLPPEFSVDEVMERIFVLEKIETGLQQSQKGKVTPDEDLDKKLPKWLV
jgi:hypothetical protein